MNTVLLVIIVVSVAVLLLLKPSSPGSGQFSYRLKPYLLRKAERSFYGVLSQAVGDKALTPSRAPKDSLIRGGAIKSGPIPRFLFPHIEVLFLRYPSRIMESDGGQ